MPNPLFNVDRRPCAHLSGAIAFGGNDARWSSSANYCLPSYNTSTGTRYAGVTADSAIGVQETLKSMTYLYDRGIRRFMINSPAGNIFTGGIPAYGGIWSPMSSRYVIRPTDNAKIPNPYPECWKSIPGQTDPPTIVPAINAIDLDTLPFNSVGRVNEWRDQLKFWLVGSFGYSAHPDAEVYIYFEAVKCTKRFFLFLEYLSLYCPTLTLLYEDNTAAIVLVKANKITSRL